jgi:large subunit ribosomal protein L21
MFAIVRTGGKQYRVAPGDKIVVEKLAGEAGDTVNLTDVLLAGTGSDLMATAGLIVGAEIVAQAKSEKVTVFKKRRRHNYRRKAGHRQQLTILKIVSIGDKKAEKKAAPAKEAAPAKAEKPAAAPKPKAEKPATAAVEASTSDAAPAKAAAKKAAPKAAAKTEKK